MHPHHHRRLLMTSHVPCDAWAFAGASSSSPTFPVCTADVKRVLLPNICVQGPELTSDEIALFLHDDVRPFTMAFVFKLSFKCNRGLQPAVLVSIVQRISATMPYLETLCIGDIPEELGDRASAFVAALPSSLRVLQLPSPWKGYYTTNAHQVQVLSKLPFLEELDCGLGRDGLNVLLPLTLPAGDQSFFPRLRSLTVMVQDRGFQSNLELCQRVLQSPLVKQLRALECYLYDPRVDSTAGSISLEPLAHIERLSNFLVGCNFSTAPDFSLLENCRDLGDSFFAFSGLSGAVDLSGMQYINRIGNGAFGCTQTNSIIFPPTLKFIGRYFGADSSITELDLSPCAHSLQFVDTDHFFFKGSLQKFDTTPLLGAIGSYVGTHFLQRCSSLTEVDLAGLRGVRSIGDLFLASCGSLHKVRGCDALCSVEKVGDFFLADTHALEECNLSQLAALRECGDSVLAKSALEKTGRKILKEIMNRNKSAGAEGAASR